MIQPAGILEYVEDLEHGSNANIESKDFTATVSSLNSGADGPPSRKSRPGRARIAMVSSCNGAPRFRRSI